MRYKSKYMNNSVEDDLISVVLRSFQKGKLWYKVLCYFLKELWKKNLLVFFSDQQTNQTDELWSRQTTMKYPMFLVFTGLVAMGKGIFLIIVIGVLWKNGMNFNFFFIVLLDLYENMVSVPSMSRWTGVGMARSLSDLR